MVASGDRNFFRLLGFTFKRNSFVDFDMYGVVNSLECMLFSVGLISGAFAWKSLQKVARVICAVFLLIPSLLLPQTLWWGWTNAIHPPHLKEEVSLNNAAFESLKNDFKTAEAGFKNILQKEKSGYFRGHSHNELMLADCLEEQGKVNEAEQVYLSAIAQYVGDKESYEPKNGSSGDMRVTCVQNLAIFYMKQKRYSDAEPLFKRALMMHIKNQWLSYEYVLCNEDYARLLLVTARPDEAKGFVQEAQRIRNLHGWKD
jgi:tetratricopeptide (TPR) repeat protein